MKRVLVVDDEPDLLDLVSAMLGHEGFSVATAANAEEALRQLADGGFDVVVTDVQMPGADGFELLEIVRESEWGVPVILVSAYPTHEGLLRSVELGSFAYIEKPIDVPYFVRVVRKAAWRSSRRSAVSA